jgi:hypothetical protein
MFHLQYLQRIIMNIYKASMLGSLLLGIIFIAHAVPTKDEAKEALRDLNFYPEEEQESIEKYHLLLDYFTNHERDMEYVYLRAHVVDTVGFLKSLRGELAPLRYCLLWLVFAYFYGQTTTYNAARLVSLYGLFGLTPFCIIAIIAQINYSANDYDMIVARLEHLVEISAPCCAKN